VAVIFLPIPDEAIMVAWIAQIATAFALKRSYLIKTYPKDLALPIYNAAKAIAEERQRRGDFKSIMDIKRRTGIPFSAYRHLT